MLSLFQKSHEEIVAVFDIGSGSIGAALVKLQENGRPVILYSHREPLSYVPHPTSKYLLSSMLKLLKSVTTHVAKDGLAHVKVSAFGRHRLRDAYCIFSSPWYVSETKVLRDQRDKQTVVTRDALDKLVTDEQNAFGTSLTSSKYEQIFGAAVRPLEKQILNTRLNGYEISQPIGKSAKELELTLFTSFAADEILTNVESTLRSIFHIRSIHHYSYGYVSWNASRLLFPGVHDYFFLDISGEATDVSLVIRDTLVETVSFGIGRSTLLRKIVKDLGVESDIALSFLSMHFGGKLDAAFSDKLTKALEPISADWFDEFTKAMKKFQNAYALPRAAFVTADLDVSHLFLNILTRKYPVELGIAENSLAVTYVGASTVQMSIELLPNTHLDPFLAIEGIFLNSLFSSHT